MLADSGWSPAPLALGGVLVACHLSRLVVPLTRIFFLVPGHAVTRPWQFLTANIFEDSLANLLLSLCVLVLCSRLLGRGVVASWSARELTRYLILVGILQTAASWLLMVVLYVLFRESHFLFAQLGGFSGVLAAILVALKREHIRGNITSSTIGPTTTAPLAAAAAYALEHAPTLLLLWCLFLVILSSLDPPDDLFFALNGIIVSWAYLRYYQPHADASAGDASAGDASEEFAFANLFPKAVRLPLAVVGEGCFGALSSCCCGLFPPAGYAAARLTAKVTPAETPMLPGSLLHPSAAAALTGGGLGALGWGLGEEGGNLPLSVTTEDPQIAERRRQRARQLLEERLKAKMAEAQTTESQREPIV